jgi:hypothetical protein
MRRDLEQRGKNPMARVLRDALRAPAEMASVA